MKKIDKTPEWQENIGVSRAVRNCLAVAITTVSVLIAGCATSGGDPLSASAADVAKSTLDTMPVTLSFDGQFAGEPFSCDGQYLNTGLTDVPVTVSEYKLYVSRVRMLTSDGVEVPVVLTPDGLWQQEDVALLDFENGQGNCSNGTSPTNTRLIHRPWPRQVVIRRIEFKSRCRISMQMKILWLLILPPYFSKWM